MGEAEAEAGAGPRTPPSTPAPAGRVATRHASFRPAVRIGLVLLVAGAATVAVLLGVSGGGDPQHQRVALLGDSLLAGAAPDIATDLRPDADTVNASLAVGGAGLLDTNPDWLTQARTLVADFDPTVAVVEYVGNYAVYGGPLPGVTVYSKAFFRDWALQAQRLENILTTRGATVYWVLGPPIAPRVPEKGLQRLDEIYEDLQAPGGGAPPLINITPAVTGGTDRYQTSLPGPNGHEMRIHLAGGVHFTAYGDSLMARAIATGIG